MNEPQPIDGQSDALNDLVFALQQRTIDRTPNQRKELTQIEQWVEILADQRDAARVDADRLAIALASLVPYIEPAHHAVCCVGSNRCSCYTYKGNAEAALHAHRDERAKR